MYLSLHSLVQFHRTIGIYVPTYHMDKLKNSPLPPAVQNPAEELQGPGHGDGGL